MTEAIQTTTPSTYVPPPPATPGGELTEGERRYFTSGGTDTSGLVFDKAPTPTQPAPAAPAQTEAKTADTAPTTPDEPAIEGEIDVANGVMRDAKGRFVPKSAFLRVKEDAKKASTEAQSFRDELLRTRERLAILTEVLPKDQTPAQQATQPAADVGEQPDPEQDLFAWVKWAKAKIAANEEAIARQEETHARVRQSATLQTFFTSDVDSFRKENADFTDALNHGMTVREKMLGVMGVPEDKRRTIVLQEIGDIVKECHAKNTSVAARLYEMAQTLGYTKKAPAVDPSKMAAEELARLSDAQRASKTLGGGGGAPAGSQPLTPALVANMSEADYSNTRANYIAKHGREAWSQFLAGGR